MTDRQAPRFALALLERFVPGSEPLAGDLVEAFHHRPSRAWFWIQVLAAIAMHAWRALSTGLGRGACEIRPLRLVDVQPADAAERARRFALRFPAVNLSASPVAGVGGLGLAIFGGLMTIAAPGAWWLLGASAVAGGALGGVMIAARRSDAADRILAL
jgi:hypothetical protein